MSNKSILIADDEYGFRFPLLIYLKQKGFNAFEASNRKEIIARISDVDLLIMDVIFPDQKEGIDIVHNIRKSENKKIKNIPVIFYSILSKDMVIDQLKDMKEGEEYEWLQKPFEFETLLDIIKKII